MNVKPRCSAVVILIALLASALFSTPASAHRSGCHRWHSCPSDTGSYTCGDLGYSTYCGGALSTTASERLQGNPPPNWDSYVNWPFTLTVKKDDPIVSLVNFSHRTYAPTASSVTTSDSTLSLASQLPKTTSPSPTVTIYDFASNSPYHSTRLVERKATFGASRRIVGRFVNTTKGPISYGTVWVYRNADDGQPPRSITLSYLKPTTILVGQEAYYDFTVSGHEPISDWAVGVTDWLDLLTLPKIHRYPVTDISWHIEGQSFPTLKVSATVLNDTTQFASFIDVLVVVKDKRGSAIRVEHEFVSSISAGKTAVVSSNIYSDFDGLASLEVIAYSD